MFYSLLGSFWRLHLCIVLTYLDSFSTLQFALITLTLRIFISLILEGYRNSSRTSEPFSTVRLTLLRSFRCFASRRTVGVSPVFVLGKQTQKRVSQPSR